jgi:hypothetical protein
MKHILGMAKSNLDLKGAKSSKLEFDYLRLVYAVKELRKKGDEAYGYLIVMTPAIEQRVKHWETKYQAEGCVRVCSVTIQSDVENALMEEKARNVNGMIAGALGKDVGGRSSANVGQTIGESALKEMIGKSEPNVQQVTDKGNFPLGIHWDFYGVIQNS